MDAEAKAMPQALVASVGPRSCPRCKKEQLSRKQRLAFLPLGRYRCQNCRAEMVLPLRFQGSNRVRYLHSLVGVTAVLALLGFGLQNLLGVQQAEALSNRAAVVSVPARDARESLAAAGIVRAEPAANASADDIQITPALAEQQILTPAPTQLPTLNELASQDRSSEPISPSATEKSRHTAAPTDVELATSKRTEKSAAAAPAPVPPPAPAAKPMVIEAAKISGPALSKERPVSLASTKTPDVKPSGLKPLLASPLQVSAAKGSAPAAVADSSKQASVPEAKPTSQAEASNTLKSIRVSNRSGATRITLATSAPSEAIRLRELPSEHAYVVDFPGDWAVAPGIEKSLRLSDSKLRRLDVKHVASYLRLVLYYMPEVISQPRVNADGQGFTITVQ